MKSFALILIAALAVVAFADTCKDKFICVDEIKGKNDTCRSYDPNTTTWSLHACGVNQTCTAPANQQSYDDWKCAQSIVVPQQHYRQVGDGCKDANECVTELCVDSKCVIRKEGEACDNIWNCDAQLICSSTKTCNKTISIDGNCTANPEFCQKGTFCVTVGAEPSPRCALVYSLDDGTNATDPTGKPSTISQVCKSNVINNGTCTKGEKTNGGWPKKCQKDDECLGNQNSTGKCNCDVPNKDALGYCEGFPSDQTKWASDIQSFIKSKFPVCKPWQYQSTWGTGCDQKLNSYPTSEFRADKCYKDVGINYDYGSGSSASFLSVNLVFLFGLLGAFFTFAL